MEKSAKILSLAVCADLKYENGWRDLELTLSSFEDLGCFVHEAVEILVVFSRPTSNLHLSVDKWSRWPVIWCGEIQSSGIYQAINLVSDAVSGDYLALIHAGDRLTLSAKTILSYVAPRTYDCLFFGVLIKGKRYCRAYQSEELEHLRWWYRAGQMNPHLGWVVKRNVLRRLGRYDEGYSVAADFEYFLRMLECDSPLNTTHLPLVLCVMDSGGASNGSVLKYIRNSGQISKIYLARGDFVSALLCWFRGLFKLRQFFG